MKVAVVTDSGSNIYAQKIEMEGLFKLPLQISDENKTYLEGEEISVSEVYGKIKQGMMLKTSLPPLGRIETLFKQLKETGYELIFAVPICTGLSGTLNAMVLAAKEMNINFDYVDCFSTASNQLYLAETARKLFDQNKNIEEIKGLLQASIDDSVTYIIPDDLHHLARGGRLTPFAATLGGFLKIKPILKVSKDTEGRIDAVEKVRTMSKAQEVVIQALIKQKVDENCLICVAHVLDQQEAKNFYQKLVEQFPQTEIFLTDLISTVGVHTGLGCVAMQSIRKIK